MADPMKKDKELELYRNLLEAPTEFKDGFGWSTVAGILFCGLIMMPGSIYLGLMTGGGLGAAATWVTVILFAEISRRAMKSMQKQQLVVLLHAAQIMIAGNAMMPGGPFGQLVFRAFLINSDAARDAGMSEAFPTWWAPKPDSPAILERNLLHPDWLVPIGLIAFMALIGLVKRYTLGYFFFRLTSDVEKLPFPMAPIAAQGAMALAEMDDAGPDTEKADGAAAAAKASRKTKTDAKDATDKKNEGAGVNAAAAKDVGGVKGKEKKKSLKWRIFSLGSVMGIIFGMVQVGIPAITGLFLDKPFYLIPQPFLDTTTMSEGVMPATPTGIVLDLGVVFIGFVLPFWAVVGTVLAVIATLVMNPILHETGMLTHWQPGMDTVNTTFANSLDFWLSFGIGGGLGIAAVSIYSTIRDMRRKLKAKREAEATHGPRHDVWEVEHEGRGDYPLWIAVVLYIVAASAVVALCWFLVPSFPLTFLLIFSFVYNPLISYVNARLIGIAGQHIEIPFLKETSFMLSGAKGVEIWLAPIPIENYGGMAQSYRVNELTGVSFWSLIKADLVALPILFILSGVFWAFIWKADPIPSDAFPFAQVHWELASKNQVLHFTSTFDPEMDITDSEFFKAIHPKVIASSFGFTVAAFAVLSYFGLPVMLIYGFIRGLGGMPHTFVLEIVGALIGRYYFQKKFGQQNFLRSAPILLAGYMTGVGLISMATIALRLIQQAVSSAPF